MFGTTELQYGYKHDIIVTEAFRAALYREGSQQVKEEVKVCAYIRKSL